MIKTQFIKNRFTISFKSHFFFIFYTMTTQKEEKEISSIPILDHRQWVLSKVLLLDKHSIYSPSISPEHCSSDRQEIENIISVTNNEFDEMYPEVSLELKDAVMNTIMDVYTETRRIMQKQEGLWKRLKRTKEVPMEQIEEENEEENEGEKEEEDLNGAFTFEFELNLNDNDEEEEKEEFEL